MRVIEDVIGKRLLAPANRWHVHVAGRLDILPDTTRDRATDADLTVAVGYDGRQEIVDAVRSLCWTTRPTPAARSPSWPPG